MNADPQAAPVAPTITATEVDPVADSVRITITVPADATRIWVWRVGPSGSVAYVRGARDAIVVPSTTVFARDYEPPLGIPLTYHVQVGNDAGQLSPEATATVTVPSNPTDDPWLVDLAYPVNTNRVILEGLPELKYAIDTGLHWIIARRAPIVTSDVARTPQFELVFSTTDEDSRLRARDLLGNGIPSLLRTPPEHGVGNLYFSILEWSEQRIARVAQYRERRFVVSCVEVERPDPDLYLPVRPTNTYSDVHAEYDDYADVKASNDSYDELLYRVPSEHRPPPMSPVPWPAADV
jgi:hypothetical protein